ncbi:hypothetical protein D3C80_1833510 [compost metagenome]
MAGIWLPGWGWYRDNIPAAIDAYCLASASGATNICEHFWSTAGDLWCVLRNENLTLPANGSTSLGRGVVTTEQRLPSPTKTQG